MKLSKSMIVFYHLIVNHISLDALAFTKISAKDSNSKLPFLRNA